MNCILTGLAFMLVGAAAAAQDPVIEVDYVAQTPAPVARLSARMARPAEEGLAGARLGLADTLSTAKFTGQEYRLVEHIFTADQDPVEGVRGGLAGGARLVVLNLPADAVTRLTDLPEARDDLFLNAGASDDSLRGADCRTNLLHTLPSRTMLADALMQFLVLRRWTDILVIAGPRVGDVLFATALRGSASKFGLDIVDDRPWIAEGDLRRNAAQEVPVLTQASDYDVVVVADEDRDFGPFVQYNTWLPRPVAGNAGLRPTGFDPVLEQWGAEQLQSRFRQMAGREMDALDFATWAAIRAIGEAATRTGQTTPAGLKDYMFSPAFTLAGFKGRALSFRRWDGQMRQPVALVQAEALVAMAPLDGFLHPVTELDTLGIEQAQSTCASPPGAAP